VATMNGVPADLPPALLDRFLARVHVDQPHPDALSNLTLAPTVKATIGKSDESRVSLRQAKAFDFLTSALGEDLACRAVFGARAHEIVAAVKLARADGRVPAKAAPKAKTAGAGDDECPF
jgi:MoxR-like ATPase